MLPTEWPSHADCVHGSWYDAEDGRRCCVLCIFSSTSSADGRVIRHPHHLVALSVDEETALPASCTHQEIHRGQRMSSATDTFLASGATSLKALSQTYVLCESLSSQSNSTSASAPAPAPANSHLLLLVQTIRLTDSPSHSPS